MNKPVRVVLIGDAQIAFEKLEDFSLIESVKQKAECIKNDPFFGDNIKKKLISKKFAVTNLWRVELSQYWRLLYTIKGDQKEIFCFVVAIINHKEYDKLFGYQKR